MWHVDYCLGFSWFIRTSFAYFKIISSNLQYFNASGAMLSGPSAFPSINLFFTIRYSEDVNSVYVIFSSFCVIMVSGINSSFSGYLSVLSICLKCSYHISTLSSFLVALIILFFSILFSSYGIYKFPAFFMFYRLFASSISFTAVLS